MPVVFVSAGDILGVRDEQGIIKSEYMMAAQARLGLDAILPGERDLSYPLETLSATALPWVLSNQAGDFPFSGFIEKKVNGRRMLIFGLLDPQLLTGDRRHTLVDMLPALQSRFNALEVTARDIVVVLLHAPAVKADIFLQHPLIDVIVRGHLSEALTLAPPLVVPSDVLSAGYRGQHIGVADFVSEDATRLMTNRIEALTRSVPDDPQMAHLYTEYDKAVDGWYRAKLAAGKSGGNALSPYAGAAVCTRCHQAQATVWAASRHAQALDSLIQVGKNNDPECLACHNTGFSEQGGFLSPSLTPALANVQCEACHGPARGHAAYPLAFKTSMAAARCPLCHTVEHSPSFSLNRYWPKIVHHKSMNTPLHRQRYWPVLGEYTLLDESRPVIVPGPIVITEFFNFYCNRCYILNKEWTRLTASLSKPFDYQQIPITFGEQQTYAAIAYLAAVEQGRGEVFKTKVFEAKFEHDKDIDTKEVLISLADSLGIAHAVRRALAQDETPQAEAFRQGMVLKQQRGITATPTLIINDAIKVTPKNTGDNINLMSENLELILQDVQCRQRGLCE